jgi:sugar phosphate isomerase/epimerase
MTDKPLNLSAQVQVNVPFAWLVDRYLPIFLKKRLNPEIGLDAASLERFSREDFRRVARQFQEAGLTITLHAPFQDVAPGALDRLILTASRTRLRQAFDLLEIFRPLSIVCHAGYEARHYSSHRQQWLSHSVDTWEELAAQAERSQTRVMLENVYESDPEILVGLFTQVKASNIQFCFDLGHLHAFGRGSFPQWLEALTPYLGQLHLHDNHGQTDDHLALGSGAVPIPVVLNFLAAQGVFPLITLEPHQEKSLIPSLEYLAKIWPW